MISTFVHLPDFHARPDARNGDRYAALDQILADTVHTRVSAWLWPGDLNDARMSIEDRNALAERLVAMANLAPVVLCDGNHDVPGDLDIFGRLHAQHPIFVVHDAEAVRVRLATGGFAAIFVLPFPAKGQLVAAGVAKGQIVNDAADLLDPLFMQAAGELAEERAHGSVTLMIGHVNIAGSITSTGQPNIGQEIELSPRHLDRLGNIPKLLNHIHKPQTIAGAHYAGSICRLNWGEIEEKSYLVAEHDSDVVDVDDGMAWTITRRPLQVAPMFHIEGELTPHGGFTTPTMDVWTHPWQGCDVRVRVRFKQSEKAALDFDVVRAIFRDARRFELEPIAVPDRALRAPEVVAAVTLADKLAAYAQRPLTESERAKLEQLENGCHMAILDQVDALVAEAVTPAPAADVVGEEMPL